jgi:hypothetical protein
MQTTTLLTLLLKRADYQPVLPKLEAYLAKEHRLQLSSIFFQFNSAHRDDHLIYRFQRGGSNPLELMIRTTFYEQPIVKNVLDQGYSVPYIPAAFSIPGAFYTEVPMQQTDGACVRLVLNNSVAHFMFSSEPRQAQNAPTKPEIELQLRELHSIAKRYVEEETKVFPKLKQNGVVINIRHATKND